MNNQEFGKNLINRSFRFAKSIIYLADSLPGKQSTRVILDQLLRSATSVGANIVEAQAASSRKDFTNFLNHALKSGNETKFWLLLLIETSPDKKTEILDIVKESEELTKILGSVIASLRGKRKISNS